MSSRYSSHENSWLYLNFYSEFEDFDRYVGYGIINYCRDKKRDSQTPDTAFIRDSLRLCREQLGNAYRSHTLTRWSSKQGGEVPYEPKYVAVTIDSAGPTSQSGIVVPADLLFSDDSLDQVMSLGTITRGKLWFDDITEEEKARGWVPGKAIRYTQIEAHMREVSRSARPEKVK